MKLAWNIVNTIEILSVANFLFYKTNKINNYERKKKGILENKLERDDRDKSFISINNNNNNNFKIYF